MNWLYAVLIGGALGGVTIWLWTMNSKTPVPEGCENLTPNCSACGITDCASRMKAQKKESVKNDA